MYSKASVMMGMVLAYYSCFIPTQTQHFHHLPVFFGEAPRVPVVFQICALNRRTNNTTARCNIHKKSVDCRIPLVLVHP